MSFVKYWFNNYLFKQNPMKYCVAYSIKCIKKNIYFALLKTYNIHIFFLHTHIQTQKYCYPPWALNLLFFHANPFCKRTFLLNGLLPLSAMGLGGKLGPPEYTSMHVCVCVV